MGFSSVTYNPGSGAVAVAFYAQNFLPRGGARVNDNVATSGAKERIFEATDLFVGFTVPELVPAASYDDWDKFYAWALQGGSFIFTPNSAVTKAAAPWSGGTYFVNCVLEDTDFTPKKAAFRLFSLDCKFRVVQDAWAPPRSGWLTMAFYGSSPA